MSVLILYYHRIYPKRPARDVTLELFEWEMDYLANRYQIITLDDLLAYVRGEFRLQKKAVVLTFDDGWFDNYVYAYPFLKRKGLKATVFVSTGNIGRSPRPRATIEDYWNGKKNLEELHAIDSSGSPDQFLSWEELREMTLGGVFSVQSHGVTHSRVCSGDTIQGFTWPTRPVNHGSALEDRRPGVPIYPTRSALCARRYYPSKKLDDYLADFVTRAGGETFLKQKGAERILMEEADGMVQSSDDYRGTWESEEDLERRILDELVQSKEAITREIGTSPLHFCWPWGEHGSLGRRLSMEAGYSACYTTLPGTITVGTDPFSLSRVSTSGGRLKFMRKVFVYSNPWIYKLYMGIARRRFHSRSLDR